MEVVGVLLLHLFQYSSVNMHPNWETSFRSYMVILRPIAQHFGSFLLTFLLYHLQSAIYLIAYVTIRVMTSVCLLSNR